MANQTRQGTVTGRTQQGIRHGEIAKLAYELFLKRGGAHGSDWADWFRAEEQLRRSRGLSQNPWR